MLTLEKPLQELDDDTLIQETLKGHREAFGHLIRKYSNPLYDLACRILGNPQEAEDVLQDAMVVAYKHLSGFKHRARFSTWLYTIVLNHVRNRLRRNKTIRWHSLDASPSPDQDSPPPEMPDRGPSVQSMTENRLTLEAVEKVVETLPFEYRSIFILHYMQNQPILDIAKRLGRPSGTIKVYLHRARKLLYQRLKTKGRDCNLSSSYGV
jgi:RNA polymerase sigma-70 factor, ECF subfamily